MISLDMSTSLDAPDLSVHVLRRLDFSKLDDSVFVFSSGFEERALEILKKGSFSEHACCILVRYRNGVPGNKRVVKEYEELVSKKFAANRVRMVNLSVGELSQFQADFSDAIYSFPSRIQQFVVDISGITSFGICLILKIIRFAFPFKSQLIVYTSARTYTPSYNDYRKLIRTQGDQIDFVPRSMALEMSDNLIVDCFAGHRSGNGNSCLFLFGGYEVHRSNGVVDGVNPSMLLLMLGNPGNERFDWRLDLSKRLHKKFMDGRRCALEVVSTLHLDQALRVMERYYNFLIDDYDVIVSPICSKMHCVATYLFWERYGEVQLLFPLPIGYDPTQRPRGVDRSYALRLRGPGDWLTFGTSEETPS